MDADELTRRMWAAAIELRHIDCEVSWHGHHEDCDISGMGSDHHPDCPEENEDCNEYDCWDESECTCSTGRLRKWILAAKAALSGATASEVDDG